MAPQFLADQLTLQGVKGESGKSLSSKFGRNQSIFGWCGISESSMYFVLNRVFDQTRNFGFLKRLKKDLLKHIEQECSPGRGELKLTQNSKAQTCSSIDVMRSENLGTF